MANKKSIIKTIQEEADQLRNKFGVKSIALFGSFVTGAENEKSDIDLLVEFSKPVSMFDYLELESYLEEKLNRKVDIVTKKALKPHIGNRISKEATNIY